MIIPTQAKDLAVAYNAFNRSVALWSPGDRASCNSVVVWGRLLIQSQTACSVTLAHDVEGIAQRARAMMEGM